MLLGALAALACTDTQARPASVNFKASSNLKSPPEPQAHSVTLQQVGGRFRNPVHLTSPPGDSRLFVVEQAGRIIVVKNGTALAQPFLDISSRVKSGGNAHMA